MRQEKRPAGGFANVYMQKDMTLYCAALLSSLRQCNAQLGGPDEK